MIDRYGGRDVLTGDQHRLRARASSCFHMPRDPISLFMVLGLCLGSGWVWPL